MILTSSTVPYYRNFNNNGLENNNTDRFILYILNKASHVRDGFNRLIKNTIGLRLGSVNFVEVATQC